MTTSDLEPVDSSTVTRTETETFPRDTTPARPIEKPTALPNRPSDGADPDRMSAIKKFVWHGYKKHAWGKDELHPVSLRGEDNWGGLGATIVDSLDTIILMGLAEELAECRAWLETLSFKKNYDASTFETTIRFVGGLNSAFDLTGDEFYLSKSIELAERLMPAFDSPTGIPFSTVNLASGRAHSPSWSGGASFLSEFGTLQLEFRYLSRKSGRPEFAAAVDKVMEVILAADVSKWDGLFPYTFHPARGEFTSAHITFGARGDSFYEYLLKMWLQSGRTDKKAYDAYVRSMEGMKRRLVQKSKSGLTYIAELNDRDSLVHKMDHLVCFVPGMLALDGNPSHLPLAESIMYTCWQMYARNPTGLAPEIAGFNAQDMFNQAPHYLLRPETVESLFILWRITGNSTYRDWGWSIFNSLEKSCKTEMAYSGIRNVGVSPPAFDDRMESFFLAETLKYLYLLFAPRSLIPLDEFVFNTEAHPTRIFTN